MKQLIENVLACLDRDLRPLGFECTKGEHSFFRRRNGRRERFHFAVIKYPGEVRLHPTLGIRFDKVESIFHRTSGFEPQFHGTDTVGLHLRNVRGPNGYEIQLHSEFDVPSVVRRLMEIFHADAEPYYAKYSTLEAIDRSLNERPRERTVHSILPRQRCSAGVIVAKLLGRDDYEELVSIYRETLQQEAKGFYLPRFEALVQDLETLDIAQVT